MVTTGLMELQVVQSSSHIITTNKSTPNFLQAGCPSCRPTNSVRALEGKISHSMDLLMMEVVSGDNWSWKTCKAPVKLSPPANQHPTFYRPDALPVAKPTMSKKNIQLLRKNNRTAEKPSTFQQSANTAVKFLPLQITAVR